MEHRYPYPEKLRRSLLEAESFKAWLNESGREMFSAYSEVLDDAGQKLTTLINL